MLRYFQKYDFPRQVHSNNGIENIAFILSNISVIIKTRDSTTTCHADRHGYIILCRTKY